MTEARPISPMKCEIYARALDSRDPRFDGVFFVGITSTGVYCRPVCPARVSYPQRRRFFETAAEAERAGYRPCLRCRPELAPGRAMIDAIPRLARVAIHRIVSGALNGHSVAELARELHVSERHLRRALERETGVSPLDLALTQRLLLAKQLLSDTHLSVTRIAYASGFQSLRRFNAVMLERYGVPPSALRRSRQVASTPRVSRPRKAERAKNADLVALTVSYRPPLAWHVLVDQLARECLPGADMVNDRRVARSVEIDGHRGVVVLQNLGADIGRGGSGRCQLRVLASPSLLAVLMSLIARVRHLCDLDAEPSVVDSHLASAGLETLVQAHPGLRSPGAFGCFDGILRILLLDDVDRGARSVAGGVVREFGTRISTSVPGISHTLPSAARLVDVGESSLQVVGVPRERAHVIVALARGVHDGTLRLEPGEDVELARRTLLCVEGVNERLASRILMRTLHWPDALPISESELQRLARVAGYSESVSATLDRCRPWRAYAALHLERQAAELAPLSLARASA